MYISGFVFRLGWQFIYSQSSNCWFNCWLFCYAHCWNICHYGKVEYG